MIRINNEELISDMSIDSILVPVHEDA